MIEALHNYYLNKKEPNKSCLLALRSIILNQDTNITETQKWGMPCFSKLYCEMMPGMYVVSITTNYGQLVGKLMVRLNKIFFTLPG